MTDTAEIPFDKLPFEEQLRVRADETRAKGEELMQLPPISWKAALVIAQALQTYFSADAPRRCFVCDASRETALDRGLDRLHDEGMRLSIVLADLETFLEEKVQRVKPTDDAVAVEAMRARARYERLHPSVKPGMQISPELRAQIIGERDE
jgi:hypothetical protein